MKQLRKLYPAVFSEAGPAGRTLGWTEIERDFGPEAAAAWDRDVASHNSGNPSFRRSPDGRGLVASLPGGVRYEWSPGGESWRETDRRSAAAPGRGTPNAWNPDVPEASAESDRQLDPTERPTSEREFRDRLSRSAARLNGNGWANGIDSVYGRGSADRLLRDLWRNGWAWNMAAAADELLRYARNAERYASIKATSRRGRDARFDDEPTDPDLSPIQVGQPPART